MVLSLRSVRTVTDATPDTLSRDTVISSSNSDNKVDFTAGTKTVFCTYPAKRAPSAAMTATTYITTHSSTISDVQTMDSGVLAGPVTVSGTVTVTGKFSNYIMSTIEVDKIQPQSGTNLTIGEAGDSLTFQANDVIPNSALVNGQITINGVAVNLGGSATNTN